MSDPIAFVVRDAKTKKQLSTRITLLSQARSFADNCAMTVRIFRIVKRRRFSDDSLVAKKP